MQRWDIFCTVVDNYGDIGVCWRLAQQLANECDVSVRMWVDNLEQFACLCPSIQPSLDQQAVGSVEVRRWTSDFPVVEPADVVIEAFACETPTNYVFAMEKRSTPPLWIVLDYLSAEDWVEESHKLPSPGRCLTKYFFYPGFTPRTGGLLRERDLLATRDAWDEKAQADFWRALKVPSRVEGELRLSMFCYENAALAGLLESWANGPTPIRVIATPGPATEQISQWFGQPASTDQTLRKNSLTVHTIPFLSPTDYDRLLWSCDVNFVRGEDSFVRAQWAQRPFIWHIYPQANDVHLVKLNAFLDRYLADFDGANAVRPCWLAWNGFGDIQAAWPGFVAHLQSLEEYGKVWAAHLDRAGNLAHNLARFVRQCSG